MSLGTSFSTVVLLVLIRCSEALIIEFNKLRNDVAGNNEVEKASNAFVDSFFILRVDWLFIGVFIQKRKNDLKYNRKIELFFIHW